MHVKSLSKTTSVFASNRGHSHAGRPGESSPADNKRRARLNLMGHLLDSIRDKNHEY
jgi:hypothetical protein